MKIKINQLPSHVVFRPEYSGEMIWKKPTLKEKICGAFYRFFDVWTVPIIIFTAWIALVLWGHWYINN